MLTPVTGPCSLAISRSGICTRADRIPCNLLPSPGLSNTLLTRDVLIHPLLPKFFGALPTPRCISVVSVLIMLLMQVQVPDT